jgi:hypothetical protein
MKAYKLRDKSNGLHYKGRGHWTQNGTLYTSKGHIKNSLKQVGHSLHDDYEWVTYDVTEVKREEICTTG